ncbi:MAG: zf-HC2 domain-containing protein [Holophagae bacterium]|nr:zf-HC2 domain-containing protein [Holophagae bacterium]
MKCKEFQDYLPLFQRGLLDGEMNKQVSEHLDSCGSCRSALALENRISGGLDMLFAMESMELAPDGIADRVLKKPREEDFSVKRGRSRVKLVFRFGAVAATVVLVLLFSFLFRHSPTTGIDLIQEAPVRTAFMNESPVRTPEVREVQRRTTVNRLKENVIWISYTN